MARLKVRTPATELQRQYQLRTGRALARVLGSLNRHE